jgi:hypothetical protein
VWAGSSACGPPSSFTQLYGLVAPPSSLPLQHTHPPEVQRSGKLSNLMAHLAASRSSSDRPRFVIILRLASGTVRDTAPQGTHWYFRADRETKRQCWFLGPNQRIGEVQQKWAFMRGALETIEEDDITITFLRHALTVINGFVRETQVYDTKRWPGSSTKRTRLPSATCHRRMAQRCRGAARLRSAAWCRRSRDRWRSRLR